MPPRDEWQIPADEQPRREDHAYDLDAALSAVVGVRATVPEDAFTAGVLGTERAGHGVAIRRDGLILTIGYLVTEAESIWLTLAGGRVVPGHVIGYDQTTGFGLVQALARLDMPALPLGRSADVAPGDKLVVAGAGGRHHAVAAEVVAKREFAGYWEYVLDEAIFTAPAHPFWGGAAAIDADGRLVGIGSLQLEQAVADGENERLNMIVPIDLLRPILDDILAIGRPNRPARPWLGLYATEVDDHVLVAGLASRGPAQRADLRTGDVVVAVSGRRVSDLASFFRGVWALGNAGVEVPITVVRDGRTTELRVASADRDDFLRGPRLQ
ncbi:MAG: serine protease [Rhizobiales bacterium]|nr:serine protease [Hyphomicrobiales bacterium]